MYHYSPSGCFHRREACHCLIHFEKGQSILMMWPSACTYYQYSIVATLVGGWVCVHVCTKTYRFTLQNQQPVRHWFCEQACWYANSILALAWGSVFRLNRLMDTLLENVRFEISASGWRQTGWVDFWTDGATMGSTIWQCGCNRNTWTSCFGPGNILHTLNILRL